MLQNTATKSQYQVPLISELDVNQITQGGPLDGMPETQAGVLYS